MVGFSKPQRSCPRPYIFSYVAVNFRASGGSQLFSPDEQVSELGAGPKGIRENPAVITFLVRSAALRKRPYDRNIRGFRSSHRVPKTSAAGPAQVGDFKRAISPEIGVPKTLGCGQANVYFVLVQWMLNPSPRRPVRSQFRMHYDPQSSSGDTRKPLVRKNYTDISCESFGVADHPEVAPISQYKSVYQD